MNTWIIENNEYDDGHISFDGSKFITGNGYFGVRGTFEEYTKEQMCAVNLAGIYDQVGDKWRESVNAPNPLFTYITVNGKKYALPENKPSEHSQRLDFKSALLSRRTVWKTSDGCVTVESERFACMTKKHVMAMRYSVSADFECEIEIATGIDADVWDINGPHLTNLEYSYKDGIKTVFAKTSEKGIQVTVSEYTKTDFPAEHYVSESDMRFTDKMSINAEPGKKYTFDKICAVATSADEFIFDDDIEAIDYDGIKSEHIGAWQDIWDMSEVKIDGDDRAAVGLNYSLYQLNCIAPRGFSSMSIPARGLSAQVYKGAVFWDTEMFMIDYFIYTDPDVARTLLKYRIDTIGGAREKAKQYGLKGAYYAWESQEGGFEACSDYNTVDVFTGRPMRTHFRDKQYHVSAAVAYAFKKYIDATGDYTILRDGGMETVIECARMYRSLSVRHADSSKYELHDVVGPDEYHERVNNNAYTNKMAQCTFRLALEYMQYCEKHYPQYMDELDKKYGLDDLRAKMKDSAENMLIKEPDPKSGVIEQFDGYFGLRNDTIEEVRAKTLKNEYWGGAYGPAVPTKILKQADVVAMLSIFKDDYSGEVLKNNYEYYESKTEHGSSLSACMYSLLACRVGKQQNAYDMFLKSAEVDLAAGGREWAGHGFNGGTHPASQGGSWIAAINGFAGIGIENGNLVCRPALPNGWKKMNFKLKFKGKLYCVEATARSGIISEVVQ